MSDVIEQAKGMYPILNNTNLQFAFTPNQYDTRKLEFWPPGESGSGSSRRPESIPEDMVGIQVINPSVKPLDILGEYVSHWAVNNDPELSKLYGQFRDSLTMEQMQKRYKEHQRLYGEKRPFEQWLGIAGIPELFRGYTFEQFPQSSYNKLYTEDQLSILDAIRSKLKLPLLRTGEEHGGKHDFISRMTRTDFPGYVIQSQSSVPNVQNVNEQQLFKEL